MKTNLDKRFKTNDKLEKEGVWFDMGDGTKFRLRRFVGSNPNVKSAMAQLHKPHAKQIEMGTLPFEKEREIAIKLFLAVSLVDWDGIVIDDKPTPYDPKIALEFFKHLPDVFAQLMELCQKPDPYLEDLGNS